MPEPEFKSPYEFRHHLERIATTYVAQTAEQKVQKEFDRIFEFGSFAPHIEKSPECLSIFGPSRWGKTRLIQNWLMRHPAYTEGDDDIIPALYVRLDGTVTTKGLMRLILEALGLDPDIIGYGKKDEGRLLWDVVKQLRRQKVQIVFLDEVQHLIERTKTTRSLIFAVANQLKTLVEKSKIPFVFVGIERGKDIAKFDEQIAGRNPRTLNLHRLIWDNPNHQEEYLVFLRALQDAAGFPKDSLLYMPETALCIFAACDGLKGKTADFILQCAMDAYLAGMDHISRQVMKNLADLIEGLGPERNPFSDAAALQDVLKNGVQPEGDKSDPLAHTGQRRGARKPTTGEMLGRRA